MHSRHPYKRSERVSELVQQILSEIFLRQMQHHDFENVTVTAVRVTDDLQHARVYYRVLQEQKRPQVEHALIAMVPQVRKELGRRLQMRYTPNLHFEYDKSMEEGERINALLASLHTTAREEE